MTVPAGGGGGGNELLDPIEWAEQVDSHRMPWNTPSGKGARTDEGRIRAAAVAAGVPCVTTFPGCAAVVQALEALAENPVSQVKSLQDWMPELSKD